MNPRLDPRVLFGVGLGLLLLGFALPALMILQIIESTLLGNFIAYAASFMGLMLGFIGAVLIIARHRGK